MSRERDALRDFAEFGIRADLRPTLVAGLNVSHWPPDRKLIGFFYDYLERIDRHVRERAREALGKDPPRRGILVGKR